MVIPKVKKPTPEQPQYANLAIQFFRRIQVPKKDAAPLVLSPADKKKFGGPKFADYLVDLLNNGTKEEQENAAYALGIMGANKMLKGVHRARAVIALTNALNSLPRISASAAFALGKIGDKSAIPFLLRQIPRPNPTHGFAGKNYTNYITALGELNAQEAVPKLLSIVNNENVPEKTRITAIYALGLIGTPRVIKPITHFATMHHRHFKYPMDLEIAGIAALGQIGDTKVQNFLTKELDAVSNVQSYYGGAVEVSQGEVKNAKTLTYAFIRALSNFDTREAKIAIAKVLDSEQKGEVKSFTITVLSRMGKLPLAAVQTLIHFVEYGYPPEVVKEAEDLLLKIRRTRPVKK